MAIVGHDEAAAPTSPVQSPVHMAQQFYLPPFDHERLSAPAPAHRVVGRPRPKDSTDVGNRVLTGQETELYRLRYLNQEDDDDRY